MARSSNANLTRGEQTIRVITRFWLRLAILIVFAAFSATRFDHILLLLLIMSTVLSAVLAIFKREVPFSSVINHWDEAIVYAGLCCLIVVFDHHVLG